MTPYNQFFAGHDGDALEISNQTSGAYQPADWFIDWATGGKSDAGVAVTGYTALTHCPLWQGVNIIAGDLGQVPIRLVKDIFTENHQHNAAQLLRIRPNDLQTPQLLIETLMQWALIWGNGVAWTPRVGSRITDIIPLRPDCLWPELIAFEDSQILLYHYASPTSRREFVFFPDEVVHIQGLTGDGVWGYPLWQIARNTIGQGLAIERYMNRSFANGVRVGGMLKHPGKPSEEARKNIRREFEAAHSGAENAGRVVLLSEAMDFVPNTWSHSESQSKDLKEATRIDAASLLNLPAYKLNATDAISNHANMEEQSETYKQMTLTRWACKMNQEFKRKLLTDAEWKSGRFEFVFDWDAFMRADIDTLTLVGDRCVKGEIMNRNEARKMIGLPPYPGGEKFGSPAINPQAAPRDSRDSPDNGRPPANKVENTHKDLIFDRILHLLECETTTVRRAVNNAKFFVHWLDDFYLKGGFAELSAAALRSSLRASKSVGIVCETSQPLEKYAKQRHAALLEVCDSVTKDQLPEAVEKIINSNQQLVAQGLLATALGGENGTENNQ